MRLLKRLRDWRRREERLRIAKTLRAFVAQEARMGRITGYQVNYLQALSVRVEKGDLP